MMQQIEKLSKLLVLWKRCTSRRQGSHGIEASKQPQRAFGKAA
jgi:hypothetical protein